MDRGACRAAVRGVTQSRTRLKRLSSSRFHHTFFFFNWPPPSPGLTSVDLASPFIPGTKKLSLHPPGLSRPPLTSHFCSPVRFQSGPLSNTSIVLLSFLCARLCHLGEGIHGVGKSRLLNSSAPQDQGRRYGSCLPREASAAASAQPVASAASTGGRSRVRVAAWILVPPLLGGQARELFSAWLF